jgi:hypothetical protein
VTRRKPHTAPAPSRDVPDPILAAVAELRAAGHVTMRQNRVLACWHCDSTGMVDLIGARGGSIFEKGCSK